jgi:hypothetical protein
MWHAPGKGFIDSLQSDLKTRKQSFCMSAAILAAVNGFGSDDRCFRSTTLSASCGGRFDESVLARNLRTRLNRGQI